MDAALKTLSGVAADPLVLAVIDAIRWHVLDDVSVKIAMLRDKKDASGAGKEAKPLKATKSTDDDEKDDTSSRLCFKDMMRYAIKSIICTFNTILPSPA